MPGTRQGVQFPWVEGAWVEAERPQRVVQVLPVQHVQGHERSRAGTYALYRGLVLASPRVRERVRIEFQAMPVSERSDGHRDP